MRFVFLSVFLCLALHGTIDAQGNAQAVKLLNDGFSLQQQQKINEAIEKYSAALELDPGYAKAWFNRATCHEAQNNLTKALADYNKAIQLKYAPLTGALYNRGRIYSRLGDISKAEADFEEAVRIDSTNCRAWVTLGEIRYNLNDFSQSMLRLKKAIACNPVYPSAWLLMGNVWQKNQQPDTALLCYDIAIRQDTTFALAYYNRSFIYRDDSNFVLQVKDLAKALQLPGANASWNADYAEALFRTSDFKNCAAIAGKVLAVDSANSRIRWFRALSLSYTWQYEAAGREFTSLISTVGRLPDYFYQRSICQLGLGKNDSALADISRAIANRPDNRDYLMQRGNIFIKLNKHKDAMPDFSRALELAPANPEPRYYLGVCKSALKDFSGATDEFTAYLAVNNKNDVAYLNRGIALYNQRKFTEALADFNACCKINPQNVHGFLNLARAHGVLGNKTEGLSAVNKALELKPGWKEATDLKAQLSRGN